MNITSPPKGHSPFIAAGAPATTAGGVMWADRSSPFAQSSAAAPSVMGCSASDRSNPFIAASAPAMR